MSSNPTILGYYVYSLVVIGVFIYNCRNWPFVRMTLLYYVFLTSFAYLLIYGSALFNIIEHIFHTKHPGAIATIIIFAVSIGVLWVSCTYLSKAIEFLIAKLTEWMGIKVID